MTVPHILTHYLLCFAVTVVPSQDKPDLQGFYIQVSSTLVMSSTKDFRGLLLMPHLAPAEWSADTLDDESLRWNAIWNLTIP